MHHLTQALIPVAGVGVFLGLSATTVSLLRAEHVPLWWVTDMRLGLLGVANLWSAWLGVASHWTVRARSRDVACVAAMLWFIVALAVVDSAWYLMFWGFSR